MCVHNWCDLGTTFSVNTSLPTGSNRYEFCSFFLLLLSHQRWEDIAHINCWTAKNSIKMCSSRQQRALSLSVCLSLKASRIGRLRMYGQYSIYVRVLSYADAIGCSANHNQVRLCSENIAQIRSLNAKKHTNTHSKPCTSTAMRRQHNKTTTLYTPREQIIDHSSLMTAFFATVFEFLIFAHFGCGRNRYGEQLDVPMRMLVAMTIHICACRHSYFKLPLFIA